MVNLEGTVYTKQGSLVKSYPLATFYQTGTEEEKTALVEWAAKLNARPCLARKNRSGRWTLIRVDEVNVLDLFDAAA